MGYGGPCGFALVYSRGPEMICIDTQNFFLCPCTHILSIINEYFLHLEKLNDTLTHFYCQHELMKKYTENCTEIVPVAKIENA